MKKNNQYQSNYDIFKQEALHRFLTFDQQKIISRLHLDFDEEYIYVIVFRDRYRISRKMPVVERFTRNQPLNGSNYSQQTDHGCWTYADSNEVLTLCDLLCHCEKPICLSNDFMTLESLNRVKGGTTGTTLAGGMFKKTEQLFDGKDEALRNACENLGGVPAGKGDIAFEISFFEPIHIRFSFYHADEDFDAKLSVLFPADICDFLHYETLYYLTGMLTDRIKAYVCTYTE